MEHYVIFFCDDCKRLDPAIAAFVKVHPGIMVHTASELNALLDMINRKKPELLLLYFHDREKSYIEILRAVRETATGNSIPLLVYHDLPAGPELESAFLNFRKSTA